MLDSILVTVSLNPIIHVSAVSFSISKDLMEKKKNVWITYNYSVVLSSGEHWLDEVKYDLIDFLRIRLQTHPEFLVRFLIWS